MAMDVFTSVFDRIDSTVIQTIAGGTANLLAIISPAIAACFVVYVMFVAWSYWQNGASIEGTMIDLVKRVAAWGIILGFSMNLAGYNSYILPIVLHLGDGLSQAFSGSPASDASALDALTQSIIDVIVDNREAASEVGGLDGIGATVDAAINNMILIVASAIFLIIAAAYLVLAKVFLAILAVVGPIFLGFALFPATRQFAMAWINQVLNYSLLMLFLNVTAGVFLSYISGVLQSMSAAGGSGMEAQGMALTTLMHIVLAVLMFVVILLKLPELASGLAGGVSANGFSSLARAVTGMKMATGARSAAKAPKTGGSIKAESAGK